MRRSRRRRGSRCRGGRAGRRFPGSRLRRFGRSFLVGQLMEMLAHELGVIEIERTRVRLLLGNPDLRQVFDEHLGLDLQFPS